MTQAATNESKAPGDISNAFVSLSGTLKDAEPLDDRYHLLKERILSSSSNESQSQTAERWHHNWTTLLSAISAKAPVIQQSGPSYIPTISFTDIQDAAYDWHTDPGLSQSSQRSLLDRLSKFHAQYCERGVAVIKGVIEAAEIADMKKELREYIDANRDRVNGFPKDDMQVFEIYWSSTQIRARAHPRMRLAQQFLLSFWHGGADETLIDGLPSVAALPMLYVDRLRMRQPGDAAFALGPHVDGGSVERWEEGGYGLGNDGRGTFREIWEGDWRNHDPWYYPGRLKVESDIYKGVGACSVFRAAQGWLSLSEIAPGEGHLLVNPLLKEALTYWLMRPFFENKDEGWKLEKDISSKVHGASPGFGQEINEVLHPHLMLDKTMIHMPTVEPGDFVVWHADSKLFRA
ncbi:DUF1479-domain-containing protein [Microthyrium microscopicum]|uniref:DUF1479-domain-containing protein n=1 Tax=Microthyrium microscopicum TaxID=703497 RepID=A0A6A6U9R7_9PEZI|nr:DUF1479-domain-containing protein [Microthyrium microscopicum]